MKILNLRNQSILAVVVGFLAGLTVLVVFVTNQKTPEHSALSLNAIPVAVIKVQEQPLWIEAKGYGVARPTEKWRAVANVTGRVVERHPNLENGAFIPKGTLLLQLDPSRYQLKIEEARAELVQLSVEEKNTVRLLEIEQRALALAEQELARIERLAASGSVSSSQLDSQRRQTLGQQHAVTQLENVLELIPARRDKASIRLSQALQDLNDTQFFAPYDLRLSSVHVEREQFINIGQPLFEAENISAVEVEARIPFTVLRRLMKNIGLSEIDADLLEQSNLFDFSSIEAHIELVSAPDITWKGTLVRIASGLDPVTRAARVVVRVDDPWENAQLPDQPPMQSEMYIRVKLTGTSSIAFTLIPSSAVHRGEVYLADEDDRLVRRKVNVLFEQRGIAAINEGLNPGDRVILNDLQPAINGIQLLVRRDFDVEQEVSAKALGQLNIEDE